MPGTYPTNAQSPPLALAPEDAPRVRTPAEGIVLFCNDDNANKLTVRKPDGTDVTVEGFVAGVQDLGKGRQSWTSDSGPLAGDTFQKYQPTEANSDAWIVGTYDFSNPNGTRHNHVWTMGWNLAPSPAQAVAGQPAFGIGFEQHYQPNGSDNFFEHHLYYVRADGTQRRPISWSANKATHYIDGYIEANRFSWYSQAGAVQPTFSIDTDVNTVKIGGSLYFAALPITDKAAGGAIGTAAATVDIFSSFDVSQTTGSQTLTLPSPTDTGLRREVSVSNVGSQAFTMLGASVTAGASIRAKWTGAAWSKFI